MWRPRSKSWGALGARQGLRCSEPEAVRGAGDEDSHVREDLSQLWLVSVVAIARIGRDGEAFEDQIQIPDDRVVHLLAPFGVVEAPCLTDAFEDCLETPLAFRARGARSTPCSCPPGGRLPHAATPGPDVVHDLATAAQEVLPTWMKREADRPAVAAIPHRL